MKTTAMLEEATKKLARCCRRQRFAAPVTHVYHPLEYALESHLEYLCRYGNGFKRAVFVGMNPGPWGMAQTGIPFGDVVCARDYLGIETKVKKPRVMHDKRPVEGFECRRREVSGSRLWELFEQRYGAADDFFQEYFVVNYCPLLFLRDTGANLTPDKLPAAETAALYRCCDEYLRNVDKLLRPQVFVGVGGFAELRLNAVFCGEGKTIGKILHPSPASPAANKGFAETATVQLKKLGL